MSPARQITKAVRKGKKARVALAGPSGSGKTWTALTLARELVPDGRILVIDTERGSASLYADRFEFEVLEWEPPYDPREVGAQVLANATTYDVIILDSLTHFWQGEGGTLDIVDGAAARASGNKFAGWKTGTPAQNEMVDAMLAAPAHVIATMRSKMEYVQEKDAQGRTTIRKVGMQPIQREGIEYEFTLTADIDIEHRVTISKTRCDLLADKQFQPGRSAEMAKVLGEWLDTAADAPAQTPPDLADDDDRARLKALHDEIVAAGNKEAADQAWKESGLPAAKNPTLTKPQVIQFEELLRKFLPEPAAAQEAKPAEAAKPTGGNGNGAVAADRPDRPSGDGALSDAAKKLHQELALRCGEVGVKGEAKDALVSYVTHGRTTTRAQLTEQESKQALQILDEIVRGDVRRGQRDGKPVLMDAERDEVLV